MSLQGKVAIVTGAATGIGSACAIELARQGAAVVVNYNSEHHPGQPIVDEITAAGGRAMAIQADVSDPAEVSRLVAETVAQFGKVDVLVNNAGIEHQLPFLDITPEDWDSILAVDLKGPFLCTQ